LMPDIEIAGKQIDEIRNAIVDGDYSALKILLLDQAVTLHSLGNQFIVKAEALEKLHFKKECVNVAVRCFSQSQRTIATIRLLEPGSSKN
jgi:hypothetical protein